ncbi:MAG TPA: hypothetical protein VMW93_06910 [bacterium]|nr:hypothetical protein [bacterium]
MNEELKEELRRLGVDVRSERDLPPEVREMITRYAPGMPGRGRVGVEPGRLADEQVFVYDDERLTFTIPVPSLDVFEAVVRELERLGPDLKDVQEYVTVLARAFWFLCPPPERRGFLRRNRPWREPGDDEALRFLERAVPRADAVLTSVREALFALVECVTGKRVGGRAARYCGLAEAVVDVAARFGARPKDVMTWNAAEFFATWEALCNVAREEEAAAEEARRRWPRK